MAFLDKTGLQTLTNKLVQGDAIKVASHRGKNVKEVIDNIQRECENVALPNTMTLENRVNEFKIGQGRDVDVSGDVEEGKIEVELQGKTWQNVVHGKKSVQSNIFTIENGKYVFNNNATRSGGIVFSLICKPNTTYTLIINFLECALGDNTIYIDGHSVYLSTINKNLPKTKGTHAISFVTKDDVTDKKMKLAILSSSTSKLVIDENIIVLEGDHTQTPIEELPKYFEGIKSSFEDGIVEVEVQGKNLLNKNNIVYNKWIDSANGLLTGGSNTRHYMDYTKIEGGRTIVLSGCTPTACYVYSDIGVCIGERSWQGSFSKPQKLPIEAKYIRFTFDSTVAFENMQLEYSTTSTTYEPYYKKKISFNIGEPLRSLPNGICDEIRNNNGQWELIRRTGCTQVDGINTYFASCYSTDSKTNVYEATLRLTNVKKSSIAICNKYSNIVNYNLDSEHFYTYSSGDMVFFINKNKIDNQTGVNLTEKANNLVKIEPIEIIYELAKPIITPIEPIEFNTSQGAIINISSDISPTSTHKVILNRAGQIEQGIELIANLKSRVNELENIYDSNLIATQYKLDNLKLNYELEREED